MEPRSSTAASWPTVLGLRAHAIVALAIAGTYVPDQTRTAGTIKVLAVASGGNVIALVTAADKKATERFQAFVAFRQVGGIAFRTRFSSPTE